MLLGAQDDEFYQLQLRNLRQADADKIFEEEGIEMEELEGAMRSIFAKIALPFSPHKSHNVREAELADILKRCGFDTKGYATSYGGLRCHLIDRIFVYRNK